MPQKISSISINNEYLGSSFFELTRNHIVLEYCDFTFIYKVINLSYFSQNLTKNDYVIN